MAKYNYGSIVSKVISDFNSIYDALAGKNVKVYTGDVGTALNANTTGVKTEDYAGLITNQLFRVGNAHSVDSITAPSGVITDYRSTTQTLIGSPTITYGADTGTISVNLESAGYYDSTTGIEMNFTGATYSTVFLSSALSTSSTTPYSYVAGANQGDLGTFKVAPAANTLLKEVNIAEGSLDLNFGSNNSGITAGVTNLLDLDFTAGETVLSGVTLTAPNDLTQYVTLSITGTSDVTNALTITPTLVFNPGYVSTVPNIGAIQKTITENTESTTATIYIPKGAATATVTGGALSVTDDQTHNIVSSSDDGTGTVPNNVYTISVASASAAITGETTTGWVDGHSNLNWGTVNGQTKRLYIAKGAVPDNSVTVNLTPSSSTVIVNSQDNDAYTVSISRDSNESATSSTNITEGYVEDDAYVTTTTVNQLDLSIPKGKAVVEDTVTSTTYTDTNSIGTASTPSAAQANNFYTITPNVSVTTSIVSGNNGSKEGYLVPGQTTITGSGLTNEALDPYYIPKGSATITHSLTGANAAGNSNQVNILQSNAPSSGDYYTITSGASIENANFTPGYIADKSEISVGSAVTYYIPEAVFQYVSDSTAGDIIQVQTGGYVAAGAIAVNQLVNGTLDEAAAKAVISTTGTNIISTTASTGAYQLSIAKGASTNAGYYGSSNGTLSLEESYYIPKGSITVAPTIDSITFSASPAKDTTGSSPVYNWTATAAGTNTKLASLTSTTGYITDSEVTLTAIANATETFQLGQAVLGVTTGTASLSATTSGITTGTSTSPYYVTPVLADATVKAVVTTAGYVDTSVESSQSEITVDSGNVSRVYIKPGDTTTMADGNNAVLTISSNLNTSNVTGPYTISVSGTVSASGTLNEGYYGTAGNNRNITITKQVSASGNTNTFTLAHGHVEVNPTTATVGFNYGTGSGNSGIKNVSSHNDSDAYYHILTATVNSITLDKSASTAGYIKPNESTDWTLGTTFSGAHSGSAYIRRYAFNGDSGALDTSVGTIQNYVIPSTWTSYIPDDSTNNTANLYNPNYVTFESNENETDGIVNDIILHTKDTYVDKYIMVKLGANAMGSNVATDLSNLQSRLNGTLVRS